MNARLTRSEIVLGLAVIAGHDRYPAACELDDIELLRIGCQTYAAREAARELVHEHPAHSMGKFIRLAMVSGDRAQLEHAFSLCASAMPMIHDVRPRERASLEVEEWAAQMQRRNGANK